jgi:hypothetical protein
MCENVPSRGIKAESALTGAFDRVGGIPLSSSKIYQVTLHHVSVAFFAMPEHVLSRRTHRVTANTTANTRRFVAAHKLSVR